MSSFESCGIQVPSFYRTQVDTRGYPPIFFLGFHFLNFENIGSEMFVFCLDIVNEILSFFILQGGAEAQRLLNRAGESDRRDERARRFGGGGGLSKAVRQVSLKPANSNSNSDPPASSVPSMRLKRAQSFADRSPTRQRKFIVGTCQQIEKAYFRLQGDVNPAWVRPEEVLTKSLDYVQNEWRKGTEWIYVDEQMRSIRQDLFVQGIETDFAIKAYSVGARIALEANDLGQFNQCQTQLKEFFQKGLGRNVQKEFWCYRLLYAAHLQQKVEEFEVLADACCREYRSDPIVKKCQVLRESLKMGNFSRYFAVSSEINEESGILDLSPPAAGSEQPPYYHIPFLLRVFLPHIRLRALALLTKAYGVPLQLKTVSHMIAFGDNHAECEQFLLKNKAVFDTNTKKLDCRKSNAVFQQAVQEKKVKLMG